MLGDLSIGFEILYSENGILFLIFRYFKIKFSYLGVFYSEQSQQANPSSESLRNRIHTIFPMIGQQPLSLPIVKVIGICYNNRVGCHGSRGKRHSPDVPKVYGTYFLLSHRCQTDEKAQNNDTPVSISKNFSELY